MEFVHPEILWGLGALAIPIVIHLLHFRRFKRVRFSQVSFLKDVQRETKATQQIKHWWILLLRLLAFAAIVLAFAQPKLISMQGTGTSGNAGHAVSLFVDNSLSMQGMGEEGQLFQSARNKASLVLDQYKPTDQFQVLTNDFSGRDQTFLTKDQALERIESIQIGPYTQSLSSVVQRASNQLNKATDRLRTAYLFSDLQKTTHQIPLDAALPDSGIQWLFVPEIAGNTPNIWVDSVWFTEPMRISERPAALQVRLRHNSKTSVDAVPLSLRVNGERVAMGTFNIVPGIPTDTVLRFTLGTPGIQQGTVHIEDAPIRFDDDWYFGYDVVDQIQIALLTSKPNSSVSTSIKRLFSTAQDLYSLTVQTQWAPGSLTERHCIILSEWPIQGTGFANAMEAFCSAGGTLVILPQFEAVDPSLLSALGTSPQNQWMEQSDRVQRLVSEHPFFQHMFDRIPERMDLPVIEAMWDRTLAPQEEALAWTERGRPFLTRLPIGQGQAFLFSTSGTEDQTNLTRHALWVPMVLRMAEQSAAGSIHQGEIGKFSTWALDVECENTAELALEGDQRWLPEVRQTGTELRISLEGVPLDAGHFTLTESGRPLASLGLNQDRDESDHAAFDLLGFESQWYDRGWPSMKLIAATSSTLPQVIQRIEQGTPLWKACVLLALIALSLETILLRAWKQSSKA